MLSFCGGTGVGGWLLMFALWAAFLALILWAVTRLFPSQRGSNSADLLDQRLAAGDIDAETYREMRDELVHHGRR